MAMVGRWVAAPPTSGPARPVARGVGAGGVIWAVTPAGGVGPKNLIGPRVLDALIQWRRRTLSGAMARGFHGLSTLAGLLPAASPGYHGLERLVGIPYVEGGSPEHQLDVYRPRVAPGLLPVVVYIHGGGFQAMSKDTHWLMAIAFARQGYAVFNINYYRLSPQHRYPAAAEDVCRAWRWVTEHAAAYGGDPQRMAVAGESAGANLAAVVAVASAWPRPVSRWKHVTTRVKCTPFTRSSGGLRRAGAGRRCSRFWRRRGGRAQQTTAPGRRFLWPTSRSRPAVRR
ncbi:MAG: alpha/beta hydrolase [Myxococcales bacterium]|nr:alpha/beta hydrolase [Myxococcales bacterium]